MSWRIKFGWTIRGTTKKRGEETKMACVDDAWAMYM